MQVPESEPDEAIIARVRAGERSLFEALMRRNNRRLYRAVRAILGPVGDAEVEDVVQEAYVRAYAHLADFEARARFSTWLTRIAVHEALARLRRGRAESTRVAAHEEEIMERFEGVEDPEQSAAGAEMRHAIEAAVDALPEYYRAVFVLRAVEELSVTETAECLEIPEETVKTRLHRARALLQQSLLARAEAGAPAAFPFDGARCDRIVATVLARIGATPGAA